MIESEPEMSGDPVQSQTTKPGTMRKVLRWTGITIGGLLAALILIVVVVVVFAIPIKFDWAKGVIEAGASEALGRPFAIEGTLALVPSIPPAVEIGGVSVGNPPSWPEADFARLDLARAELQILPLLQGELLIGEISVDGLHLNLETNAGGEPNWLLAPPGPVAAPQPEKKSGPPALKFIELAKLSLRDIVLTHHDARTGKDFELEMKEILGSAEDQQPMQLQIQGTVQGVPYQADVNAGSLAALMAGGAPWPVEMSAAAVGASIVVGGEIAEPLRGKGLALDFDLQGPHLQDLEEILGTDLPPLQSFGFQGHIEEVDGKYRISDLQGEVAATAITGSFEADISGVKPRLLGDIDIRSIDVGPLFAAMDEHKRSTAGAEQDNEQQGEAPAPEQQDRADGGVDLDTPVLTLAPLQKLDAEFKLTIHEVINGPIGLRDASLQVRIEDGRFSAPVAVTLAEVPFKGELSLAPENGQPKVAVSLVGEQSDIGELARLLSGAEGIEGKFDHVELGLTASGESVRSLIETAELRLAIAGAALSYGHDTDGRPVEFTLDEANWQFPAAAESRLEARGSVLGEAFSLEFNGGTFIENFVQKRWPLELTASGGGAELSIGGTVRRAESEKGTDLDFTLHGDRIGALSTWLGIAADAAQSYALNGKAALSEGEVRVQIDEARIGDSAFTGVVGIRQEGETPVTFASLAFEVLDLKGLASLFADKPGTEQPGAGSPETGPEALTIDVPILPQGIEIFDSDIEMAVARIKLDPADITDVSVSSRIRDGYVDEAPIAAVIAGARFSGNFGIDLRDEVPKINFDLGSNQVDVGILLAQLGVVDGLTMKAGGFALELALEGASTGEILRRSRFSVAIDDGVWLFRAPGAEQGLDIRVAKATVRAEPGQPIALTIDARIDKTPVSIEISTDPLASFAGRKKELGMEVGIALAGANLKLTGAAPLPVQADNVHFAMDLSGERFSDFDELLDVQLPPIGPYRLSGEFGTRQTGYYVQKLQVTVGESSLSGKLDLDTVQQPPRLEVDLVAARIQLDDFDTGDWSVTGGSEQNGDEPQAQDKGETLQATRGRALLSPAAMHSLNARVTVAVEEVLSGQDHLGRGTLTTTLENGRFQVDPLILDVPGGSVDVSFALEPTEQDVALEASARVEKLDYGILARRIDPDSKTGGEISVDVDLRTRGKDLQHIMDGANGHIDFGVWPRDLDAGIFELWAVNVITALASEVDKDDASKVNCVIVSFQVDDGLMRDRVLFADTSKMRIEGGAEIDFKKRTLKVHVGPKAKRPEFFSLAVPVGLSGQFEDFGININPVMLTGQAVSFITSPVHVPLRRLFRFKKDEPADGTQACADAWSMRDAAPAPESGTAK